MIDGIKIYDTKVNPDHLEQNPYLAEYWNTTVHNADAVVKYGVAEYLGLKFQIKNQKVRMQGSLHKYRNHGKHNYDDFTVVEVGKVVRELSERLEIDTQQTELNNVEFGVNVILDFPVKMVLDNLIHYKGSPFVKAVEDGMSFFQCKKAHFIIKIYDKGLQYNLPDNVLRFEIKVMRMQYLKIKDIALRYLSDLLNVEIYEPLGNILTETFNNILFGDHTLNEKLLTVKELETFLRASNPKTWEVKDGIQSEWKKLQRLESSYLNILDKYREGVNFKSVVADLIRAKSLELSTIYRPMDTVLSFENVHFLPTENQDEKTQNVHFLHFSYSVNTGHTGNSISTSATDQSKTKIKLCSGCGKPIERERNYHSLECKNRRDERNSRSNDRNNFKGRYRKLFREPSLFDLTALIKLTPEQNAWVNNSNK